MNRFNSHIKEIVKLVEINRKIIFIEKYKNSKGLFEKLEKKTKGILVIYGSYAKETAGKNSDLDVFVIGNMEKIEDLEKLYGLKINVIKAKKFNKDEPITKEIIANHIILKGVENFIELLWQA